MVSVQTVQELSKCEFDDFVKKGTAIAYFFTDWCMACLMMGPILEELGEEFIGKAKFGKINIEENKFLKEKFRINSTPKILIFKDNSIISEIDGTVEMEELEEKIRELL